MIMKPLIVFMLLGILLCVTAKAQNEKQELPYSFTHKVKGKIKMIVAPFDSITINYKPKMPHKIEGVREEPLPTRWASTNDVIWDIKKMATSEKVKGGKLWRLEVTSSKAKAISLRFHNIQISKDAYLFVYSVDSTEIWGPIQVRVKTKHEGMTAEDIKGESVIVEYFEPKNVKNTAKVIITSISHHFYDVGLQNQK